VEQIEVSASQSAVKQATQFILARAYKRRE
jgi:hypothetical protein